MPTLTPDQAIGLLVFLGLVFSVVVHECAHAIVASWCGDDTARLLGRITLNPVPHIDPFMTILFPLTLLIATNGQFAFGGAKPVPVNYFRLRHPARDMMWVAFAGPVSNVILAVCFALAGNLLVFVRALDPALAVALFKAVFGIVMTNMYLACFNLVPIPPLDGSRILAYFLPRHIADSYMQIERIGLLIVMLLLFSGILAPVLEPARMAAGWIMYHFMFMLRI
jgi:Zn-dependent protease